MGGEARGGENEGEDSERARPVAAGLAVGGLVWFCLTEEAWLFVIGVSFARYHARVSSPKWKSWLNITEKLRK